MRAKLFWPTYLIIVLGLTLWAVHMDYKTALAKQDNKICKCLN